MGYKALHGVTWSSGISLSAVVTKCLAGMRAVLDGLVHVCPCILHQVTATFHMIAKNMDVARILTCYTKFGVIYRKTTT
jgi:hypothetical protein